LLNTLKIINVINERYKELIEIEVFRTLRKKRQPEVVRQAYCPTD